MDSRAIIYILVACAVLQVLFRQVWAFMAGLQGQQGSNCLHDGFNAPSVQGVPVYGHILHRYVTYLRIYLSSADVARN